MDELGLVERLREYRIPGKRQVVLACGKCQKKMDGRLRKVKKVVKKQARVVEVRCLKLCPKGGVVVCTQEQIGRGACTIVRSVAELRGLVGISFPHAAAQ